MRRIIRGADVPRNLNTLLSLINFGKDDEPSLAVDKVRYKGEPIVAMVADSQREAYEAIAKVRDRLRAAARGVRRRGRAEARRDRGQRDLSEEHVHLSRQLRSPEAALRRRRARLRRADHVLEQRYQMSPIEHAPTETNGSIAAPDTNGALHRLHLDAGAVLLARHLREDPGRAVQHVPLHRRHRRRRLRRQGGHARPSRSRSSAPC